MGEGEGGMTWENGIETCKKHVETNCQSMFDTGYRMLGAGAQRDDMEWEVGGGFRIGNSCTPVADSCQCMAKLIQYCKAK